MLARLLLLITVVAWGCSFVATKICLDYMTPVELVGLRLLTGLPVMFVIAIWRRVRFDFSPAVRKRLFIASAILTAHFLVQITGLKYTSATNTGWIIAVSPLALVGLSFLFLKERVDRNDILGIIVATFGIIILVSGGDLGKLGWKGSIGDWLILVSAHTWALYTVATRDILRTHQPLAVIFSVLLPIGILIPAYMVFTSDWNKFLYLPAEPLIAMLYLGLISLAIAHWFWQEGVARVGAAKAGLFLYLEPLATTALAVPLLHEYFGAFTVIGGILVLGGVFWSQRRRG
jgi:drug/metabolite transporter (DMT)-like permease